MGKRSDFVRVERDFYPTPYEAVIPLIDHLDYGTTFCEPCAGDGSLVRHLEANGMSCTEASDIHPKADFVFERDVFSCFGFDVDAGTEFIITNSPWNRKILHLMIEIFSKQRPTWLLFDADWMHTKQSAPYMKWCRKIVSVGRVKWIPDSKMTGKDNCAWYLFDQRTTGQTVFIGR